MDEKYAYRTGRTNPAKNRRGLIAALLICVIFLGGLVSALSVMNIQLLRALQDTQTAPLAFSQGKAGQTEEECLTLAGMSLQEPDPVYRQLHDLPQGLYVARVEPGSRAAKAGVHPGDVLTKLDKTPVSTLDGTKALLSEKDHQLLLWRNGKKFSLTLSD